eukprot:119330_1
MALSLRSKHKPLFSGRNFFESDDVQEPPRKKQKTSHDHIPNSINLSANNSDSTEPRHTDTTTTQFNSNHNRISLFDFHSSPNSSSNSVIRESNDDDFKGPSMDHINTHSASETQPRDQHPSASPLLDEDTPQIQETNASHASPNLSTNSKKTAPLSTLSPIIEENEALTQQSYLSDVSGLNDSHHTTPMDDAVSTVSSSINEIAEDLEMHQLQTEAQQSHSVYTDPHTPCHEQRSPAPSIQTTRSADAPFSPNRSSHRTPFQSCSETNSNHFNMSYFNNNNNTSSPYFARTRPQPVTTSRSGTENFHVNNVLHPSLSPCSSRASLVSHQTNSLRTPSTPLSFGRSPSAPDLCRNHNTSNVEQSAREVRLENVQRALSALNSDLTTPITITGLETIASNDNDLDDTLSDHASDNDIMDEMENRPVTMPALSVDASPHHVALDRPMFSNHRNIASRSVTGSPSRSRSNVRGSAQSNRSNVRDPGDRRQCVLSMIEYRNRKEIGVAVIDLTAPKIDLYQFTDKAAYGDTMALITALHPKQILYPSTMSKSKSGLIGALNANHQLLLMCNLRPLARRYYNDCEGIRYLKDICSIDSLKRLNIEDNTMWLALSAVGAAISWLNHCGPSFAKHTVTLSYKSIDGYMKLDFETIKNLELVQNLKNPKSKKGTLLHALDFCATKMGRRLLRSSLYQPLSNQSAIHNRQDVVDIVLTNETFYYDLGAILKQFYDLDTINNALSRTPQRQSALNNHFNPQTATQFIVCVVRLQHNLKLLPNLVELLKVFCGDSVLLNKWKDQFEDIEYATILRDIEQTIEAQHNYNPSASIHKQQDAIIQTIKTGICGELDAAKKLYFDIESTLNAQFESYKGYRDSNIPGMRLHYTASRGHHIVVPTAQKYRLCAANGGNLFIERNMKKKNIYCTTSALKTLNQSLTTTYRDVMRHSQRVLNGLLFGLQRHITSLHILSEYIAKLDMLTSFVTYCYRVSSHCCKPQFVSHDSGPITFQNSKHPVLEQISAHQMVANDLSIYQSRNLHIITGPNGAGKSTYIKQCALLIIMAHIGCHIPAQFASLKLVDQIFSRLSNGDNLQLNQSSFFNECKDINYILSNCTSNSFVIVDELGRSTSSMDAFSFAWAVCEELKVKQSYSLFVTHFDLNKLKMYPNVCFARFRMKTENNVIQYSYKLYYDDDDNDTANEEQKDYGIVMAEMTAFPPSVIQDAKQTIEKIKSLHVCGGSGARDLPTSQLEQSLIMREHTEVIRANHQLTRQQIMEVIVQLRESIRQATISSI